MKILIDIGHPAHVHFFARPMEIWQSNGCQVIVTSRHKEIATDLLDAIGVRHHVLSSMNKGTFAAMVSEMWQRDSKLFQVVRKEKPDILTGIGGIFAAHVGFITRTPSIVFYDTENAILSNLATYPLCSLAVVPECYKAWLPPWSLRYPGYQELSYLHHDHFKPDKELAVKLGLDAGGRNFLVRTVSWQASHDINEKKWTPELLIRIVELLSGYGNVIISAEGKVPDQLQKFVYQGAPEKIHHLMGHIDLFIGESATMASECAVMGVPAVYLAATGRGYTDEQQERYGLVYNLRDFDWQLIERTITEILTMDHQLWQQRRSRLLNDKIKVYEFVAELVSQYPHSVTYFRQKFARGGA